MIDSFKASIKSVSSRLSAKSARDGNGADEDELERGETAKKDLPNEFLVIRLLEAKGGWLHQSDIIQATGWSATKTSRVLTGMVEDNLVQKLMIGRENLILLPGVEPDWYEHGQLVRTTPDPPTESDVAADANVILLVEDESAQARLFEEAYREIGGEPVIHTVKDGADALQFLRQRGRFEDAPRPALVLLDLSLQNVGGMEVLRSLEEDGGRLSVPIVVLSASISPENIDEVYARGAAAFVEKPQSFDEMIGLVSAIDAFWLTHVSTTSRPAAIGDPSGAGVRR